MSCIQTTALSSYSINKHIEGYTKSTWRNGSIVSAGSKFISTERYCEHERGVCVCHQRCIWDLEHCKSH